MTTEEKAKAYDEALERAKKLYDEAKVLEYNQDMEDYETIFPELKESEDEKIRKNLKHYLEVKRCQTNDDEEYIACNHFLAWLEKQGEQEEPQVYETEDGEVITYSESDGYKVVEPKFKVGDWIVYDYCMGRVVEITNDAYLLDTGQGIPFSCENNMHLWTIADAKEGDILAGKIDGDNYILIFKTIKDGWIETYGHYYNAVNRFCAPSQLFCRSYQGTFTPATKEQRDLLFKMMKEAGYEWDAEKHKLKKKKEE